MLDKPGRDPGQLSGLTDTNKRAIIQSTSDDYQIGDFVVVKCTDASQNALFGDPIEKLGVQEFH